MFSVSAFVLGAARSIGLVPQRMVSELQTMAVNGSGNVNGGSIDTLEIVPESWES